MNFKFDGKNVVADLKHVEAVCAIIKGDVIEILRTNGEIERIPKTIHNIGQLVGYCYVVEQKVVEMEVVDVEIEQSKNSENTRNAWRTSNGLGISSLKIQ